MTPIDPAVMLPAEVHVPAGSSCATKGSRTSGAGIVVEPAPSWNVTDPAKLPPTATRPVAGSTATLELPKLACTPGEVTELTHAAVGAAGPSLSFTTKRFPSSASTLTVNESKETEPAKPFVELSWP